MTARCSFMATPKLDGVKRVSLPCVKRISRTRSLLTAWIEEMKSFPRAVTIVS